SYSATFTPANNSISNATFDVTSAAFNDAAGNTNTAASQLSIAIDTIAPQVTFGKTNALTRSGLMSIAISFSEPITGFDIGDISLNRNGFPVNLQNSTLVGSGSQYT
ncbi:MAG: hypothetical protein ACK47R_18745, partial [Planctomycetia bacterium]